MAKKLNIQGLSRKSIGLMSCILPDPGCVLISSDASAGEPSIITNFSKDKNYHDAAFGTGIAPYYDETGTLKIDDIYLTVASISPIGKDAIRTAFNKSYDGLSFSEQWMKDPEIIKKDLKDIRQFSKINCLGIGYGMGPRKMVISAYEKGYILSFEDAKTFYKAYWNLFKGVRNLSDYLSARMEKDGFIINPFGFRLQCEGRKAFNYFTQSTLSSIFHIYMREIFETASYAQFITLIHDELIIQIPENKVEDFRQVINKVTDTINQNLNWSINLRFGFAIGKNLYEAK